MSGSVQATDRLMKELRDIYRSPSFKGGKCHGVGGLEGGGCCSRSACRGFPPRSSSDGLQSCFAPPSWGEELWPSVAVALSRASDAASLSLLPASAGRERGAFCGREGLLAARVTVLLALS